MNTIEQEYYKRLDPEEKKFYNNLSRKEQEWYLEIGTTEIGSKIVEGIKTNIEKIRHNIKLLKEFNTQYKFIYSE